jgi:hypothetical protein
MAYFEDLTPYSYSLRGAVDPDTLNVGWLRAGSDFNRAEPSEQILDRIWSLCGVSFAPYRGIHDCELCDAGTTWFQRGGASLYLGYSEIRVFGLGGETFAAPTMLYHYVERHHYLPPAAFMRALLDGPTPPDPSYFSRALERGFEWEHTSAPETKPRRFRFGVPLS